MKGRASVGLVTVALACATIFGAGCRRAPVQIPFDAPAWRAGESKLRGSMCQDLKRQLNETRPNREAVETLLGPPTLVKEYRDHQNIDWISLSYRIDTGQRIPTYLGITFRKSGEFGVASEWD